MTARRFFPLLIAIAVLAVLVFAAVRWADRVAARSADSSGSTLVAAHAALLSSELQKFRLLPIALAEYPDVRDPKSTSSTIARLDGTFGQLAKRTDAAAIYLVGRDGRTLAASNAGSPTSFVGKYYGFRPYFADAMRRGASEFFALGTVSGRPGIYLARRVDRDGRARGVVVVKAEFDAIERGWARSPGLTVATDAHGVILVASDPSLRFRSIRRLDADAMRAARRTLQFGPVPPPLAPIRIEGRDAIVTAGPAAGRYRAARVASLLAGGELIHLSPLAPALASARIEAALWLLAGLLATGLVGGALLRSAERRRMQHRARATLEREVVSRTEELRDANRRLVAEGEARVAADLRYRAAREELAQASRLGSLGQITAGVAHEINQPVAAIRAFAENADAYLARERTDRTSENLLRIVELTERIGRITGELRAFSRRRHAEPTAVRIGDVVDGTLLLMGERLRGLLDCPLSDGERAMRVVGDRIRLEQILVNLLQNALDAVGSTSTPRISLSAARYGDSIELSVSDTGPGVAPELRDTLFAPFVTGRSDGVGLGLAIARDIAREFGGDLVHEEEAGSTTFVLRLVRA